MRLVRDVLEWRDVEGEIVVLDLRSATYLAVSGAGAVLWPALVEGAAFGQLTDALVEKFDVTPARAAADVEPSSDSSPRRMRSSWRSQMPRSTDLFVEAARSLQLDFVAGEVADALAAEGIRCLVHQALGEAVALPRLGATALPGHRPARCPETSRLQRVFSTSWVSPTCR